MTDRLRVLLALAATAGFHGCARVVAPTGGPPDTTPPVLLRTVPDSGAVGVGREASLRLEFSEWVDPSSLAASVSIMPAPSRAPRIEVDGPVVTIRLREPLDSGATSILRIGEGVADFRGAKGSPAREVPFSTGPVLDSFELRLQVWIGGDSLAPNPVRARVGLYALDSLRRSGLSRLLRRRDSLDWLRSAPSPWREKAWRWSSTDSQGVARFEHLPPGRWRVLAWLDDDKDGFWRPGEEKIAWAGDLDWAREKSPRWMFARPTLQDTFPHPPTPVADSSRRDDSLARSRDSLAHIDSLRLDSLAARDSALGEDSTRILSLEGIPASFQGSPRLRMRLVRLDARRRPLLLEVGPAGVRLRVPRGARWAGELWLDLDDDGRAGSGLVSGARSSEPWRPLEEVRDGDAPSDTPLRIVPTELPEIIGATP